MTTTTTTKIDKIKFLIKYELKIATDFLTDERDRLSRELTNINRTIAQSEDALMKKDEQIRDLSNSIHQNKSKQNKRYFQNETSQHYKEN